MKGSSFSKCSFFHNGNWNSFESCSRSQDSIFLSFLFFWFFLIKSCFKLQHIFNLFISNPSEISPIDLISPSNYFTSSSFVFPVLSITFFPLLFNEAVVCVTLHVVCFDIKKLWSMISKYIESGLECGCSYFDRHNNLNTLLRVLHFYLKL